jgi:thioredoxin 1
MEIKVNSKNYKREVLQSDIPVVLEFYATDSVDCRTLDSVISEIASDMDRKVKLCKIDMKKDPDIAEEYNVSEVPMLVRIDSGDIVSWLESGDIVDGDSVNEDEVRAIFEM